MEANLCEINHLVDSNVLLPPRKRLLAGLKKQNFDGNSHQPSTSSSFDIRLNDLLRSSLDNPNLSPEEIAEASRSTAAAAVKVAEAARAAASEKAETAAKAIAAAKSALELVATVSEERHLKKNWLKKHRPVHLLYNNHKPIEKKLKKDEELARKLHRAMNSSPRISKNSSTSELRSNKHKRLKGLSSPEKTGVSNECIAWEGNTPTTSNGNGVLHRAMNSSPRISKNSSTSELESGKHKRHKGLKGLSTTGKTRVSNGGIAWEGNPPSMSNGTGVRGEVGSEGSILEAYNVRLDENTSKFNKADHLKTDNEEEETSQSKEMFFESLDDTCSIGRKRGRMKQKKLPLSICTFRDRGNLKGELQSESSSMIEENNGKTTSNNMPLSSDGMTPVGTTSMWKCKAVKAPISVKQNKVMQS